ncbi:hypothetical protein [Novosphingobium panipatense]|uniref:Outer membrane beta-barrel porin/alpha-amylase n=2 Tax=Novosphingobium panipatense TaxID=428991 RepID=A0ABY1Q7K8_9SPHN|nr:hypothetical protein [Novosphingobium panipatense]SMP61485.1 hypothetical protein SAMN06296065_103269 [Novosphingobium panipatense]
MSDNLSLSFRIIIVVLAGFSSCSAAAQEAEDADELARKISNPAAFMISVPIHADLDLGDAAHDTVERYLLDIEPVIPFRLSQNWNMISHTDFPLAYSNPAGPGGGTFGLGDINQTLSFTPAKHGGLVWALGARASIPTATSKILGTGKLAVGPSLLLLRQTKSLTMGVSADHLWSIAGKSDRADISSTEVQPFLAWHIGGGRTISSNLDVSYDWEGDQWEVPLNVSFSKVTKVGRQMMSLSIGGKYWFEAPTDQPEWGITIGAVLLFPQGTR